LSPNPASETVVVTLSNQQISPDHSSGQALDHSSGQALDHSSGQASDQQLLLLHDALGREVWRKVLAPDQEQVTIDLREGIFGTGVYQVGWKTGNKLITKSLVIVKN
jgi:hypothetical protein